LLYLFFRNLIAIGGIAPIGGLFQPNVVVAGIKAGDLAWCQARPDGMALRIKRR
jgi:hypothetical protein